MKQTECDNCIYKIGYSGEKIIRQLLKDKNIKLFMQIDLLFCKDNIWYSAEIKRQESYKPPPFEGHGLPPYQIEQRVQLYKDKNIIPMLFIIDKENNKIFYQNIIKLEKGEKIYTKTKSRVIYPINNFESMELTETSL